MSGSDLIYKTFLNNLDKAEKGAIIEEKEWDSKYIGEKTRQLVKKYDISWDKNNPPIVPYDNDLADRVFQAGMEMVVDIGAYCIDTKRQMKWSREEINYILGLGLTEYTYGAGAESYKIFKRQPEDNVRIRISAGPCGIPVSEDYYFPYLEGFARDPLFDALVPPALLSTQGRLIRSGSPWEAVGAWQEAQMSLEIIRKVGRPGLCVSGPVVSTTEIGQLAACSYGGYRQTDRHSIAIIGELKTAYHQLTKAAHQIHIGCLPLVISGPIYGGFFGGGEGLAVGIAATMILSNVVYVSNYVDTSPTHIHLGCSTYPDMITALALCIQGLARNTKMLSAPLVKTSAGPGTKEIFYEAAAYTIAMTVSGASSLSAIQSAMGRYEMHSTPLEAHFIAQVAHSSEGMARKDADYIARKLVDKYKDSQKEMNIGKPLNDLYDLDTLEPIPEWFDIYENICKELVTDFGLKLS